MLSARRKGGIDVKRWAGFAVVIAALITAAATAFNVALPGRLSRDLDGRIVYLEAADRARLSAEDLTTLKSHASAIEARVSELEAARETQSGQ